MVIALAVFLPLMGAFVTVWLSRRNPGASLLLSRLFLLAGLASALVISVHLDAWNFSPPETQSMVLNTGVGATP